MTSPLQLVFGLALALAGIMTLVSGHIAIKNIFATGAAARCAGGIMLLMSAIILIDYIKKTKLR